jgi:CD109 antigen
VAPEAAKLKVFRPFFISLNLPYSVKRGEKFGLQVLVFNYMTIRQTVDVTLTHDQRAFDFVEKNGDITKTRTNPKQYNVRQVVVPANGGSTSVFFPIILKKIGDVKLKVVARGNSAQDAVQRVLLVEPEGFRVEENKPVMIDLSRERSFQQSVSMDFPRQVVQGSEGAEISIIGDIMGPVLKNVDNLVRMPYGCGEQNMVNFVPNIVVMRYLNATQRLTPDIAAKAKLFMESGYQRELTFKRRDHSFSAFGDDDDQGSTWLSAFVVKSFKQAERYIFVDEKVMSDSIGFLLEKQTAAGDFREDGHLFDDILIGGSSAETKVPLAAYILIALTMNGRSNPRALRFLETNLNRLRKPYAVAMTTYALHLANSRQKDAAFRKLESMATNEDGLRFWKQPASSRASEDVLPYYWHEPPPADVEMTSYALLIYI